MPEDIPGMDEEQPGTQGVPIEDRIDETETLDLPEDLRMGGDDAQKEDDDEDVSTGDEGDTVEETAVQDLFPEEATQEEDEPGPSELGQLREMETENPDPSKSPDLTNPDLHGGADEDYDGGTEPNLDTNKGDDQRETNKRTRGCQTNENDEKQAVKDT
jgi:midasin